MFHIAGDSAGTGAPGGSPPALEDHKHSLPDAFSLHQPSSFQNLRH
jgi:hypothetical protein